MGCFNFDCPNCGVGTHRDEDGEEWEERDYFGADVRISVHTKKGAVVILEGKYTGYGEVEVKFGDKTVEFYPKQFAEYWDCWDTKDQYVAQDIYCEECMEDYPLTSRSEFDLSDFTLAVDYMSINMPPPGSMAPWRRDAKSLWNTAPEPAPAPVNTVVATPVGGAGGGSKKKEKKEKVAKPKPFTKEELVKKVAEMEAELERLRPLEQRFKTLEAENLTFRDQLREKNEQLLKVRKIVIGY
jgi:hypothetical protein